MSFRRLDPDSALPAYRWLYRKTRRQLRAFSGSRAFFHRLIDGGFLLLRRRFDREVFGLFDRGRPVIMATHYAAKRPELGHSHSLGTLVVDRGVSDAHRAAFFDGVADTLGLDLSKLLLPLNGHLNLGLATPERDLDGGRLHFLTSASSPGLDHLLAANPTLEVDRELLAFHTTFSPAMVERLTADAARCPPHISTRPIALGPGFRRDVAVFNRLVNRCLRGHYNFFPLDPDEEWDLLRQLRPVLVSDYFQFLFDRDEPVGFYFCVPDYNLVLRPGVSDANNAPRLLLARFRHRRARVVYAGILSAYRGQRIFPLLRARVLLSMLRRGVRSFESSYIDQDNANSQGLARSTGARISHRFFVYRCGGRSGVGNDH